MSDYSIVRAQSIKAYDTGDQQQYEIHGRSGERLGGNTGKNGVPRVQSYGLTSMPPNGSQGSTLTSDGNPDNAMLVGMEHPEVRPKNLKEGEVQLYYKLPASGMTAAQLREGEDKKEGKVFLQKEQGLFEHSDKIVLKVGDKSSITIEKDKITIKADKIDLNP